MKRVLRVFTSSQFLRFCAVGLVNTAVDVSIYAALHNQLQWPVFYANLCSTSVALAVSYLLNATFTFKASRGKRQIISYVGITLVGLWLLQPLIISSVILFLPGIVALDHLTIVPKIIAIGFTIIWNYLWYRSVVFRERTPGLAD